MERKSSQSRQNQGVHENEQGDALYVGVEFPSERRPGFAVQRVSVTGSVNVGTGRVDSVMDLIGRGVIDLEVGEVLVSLDSGR
jgi:hypothetical protein